MGVVKGINFENYPEQGNWVGRKVKVCYEYDSSKGHLGVIVREDIEEPGRMIIKLDDGRYLLSTECQYGFIKD